MTIKGKVSFEENQLDWECLFTGIEQVPKAVFDKVFQPSSLDTPGRDNLTPLARGLEWIYELTAIYQPNTAQILMNASRPILAVVPEDQRTQLMQEVNGCMLNLYRNPWGKNLSDPNGPKRDLAFALPIEIRKAYYQRCRLSRMRDPGFDVFGSLLPGKYREGIENYLKTIKRKNMFNWLQDRMPHEYAHRPACSVYINTHFGQRQGDIILAKTYHRDHQLYWIKDGDIENARLVTDYINAFDDYCCHVLLHKPGRFDFAPYTEAFNTDDPWVAELAPVVDPLEGDTPLEPLRYEDFHPTPPKPITVQNLRPIANPLWGDIDTGLPACGENNRLGGYPEFPSPMLDTYRSYPLSRSTGKNMRFIGQFRLLEPFIGHSAYLFINESAHNHWDWQSGENALLVLPGPCEPGVEITKEHPEPTSGDEFSPHRPYNADTLLTGIHRLEKDEKLRPMASIFPLVDTHVSDRLEPLAQSDQPAANSDTPAPIQLGGEPQFIQGNEHPNREAPGWQFILQIDFTQLSLDVDIYGIGYGFYHPESGQTRFIIQCD